MYSYHSTHAKGIFELLEPTYNSNPRNPAAQHYSQKKAVLTNDDISRDKYENVLQNINDDSFELPPDANM